MSNPFEDRMSELFSQETIDDPINWSRELFKNRILDVLERAHRSGSVFGDLWGQTQGSFEDAVVSKLRALSLDDSFSKVGHAMDDLKRRVDNARFAFGTKTLVTTGESEPILRKIVNSIDAVLSPVEVTVHGRNEFDTRTIALLAQNPQDLVQWTREVFKSRIQDVLNRAQFHGVDFDEMWREGRSEFDEMVDEKINGSPEAIAEKEKLTERIDDARSVEVPLGNGGHTRQAVRTAEAKPLLEKIISDIDSDLNRAVQR